MTIMDHEVHHEPVNVNTWVAQADELSARIKRAAVTKQRADKAADEARAELNAAITAWRELLNRTPNGPAKAYVRAAGRQALPKRTNKA